MKTLRKELMPISIMLALSIGLVSVVPISRCDYFIIGFLTSACLWIVYAVSWDLLGGYTGMLNFGQMLFVGVAGYTVALIELHFNIPRLFMILAGVAGGTLSSLLISLPAFRVRASYFAVVSLVLPLVFHRVTMTFIKLFGGDYGLNIDRVFRREHLYYAAIGIMAVTVIAIRLVVKRKIGMALQCIRENEETARAVGINVGRYKVIACMISAFFTSLAGVCSFYYMGHVGPDLFGLEGSFDVVIMCVVGGTGSVFGAALGGGILSLVLELMRPVAEYRNVLYAALLVVMMMVAPRGVWGLMKSLFRRRFRNYVQQGAG